MVLTQSSISAQSHQDFEWVVIDGGSNDSTIAFLEQSEQKGLHWYSEKDEGIYDAMNKGIERSKGDYLVFMNAGDAFANSDTLSSVAKALSFFSYPDVLFGGAEYVFPDGKSVFRRSKIASKCIWHGLPANHQATYYRRGALNGLLYDTSYKICGDYYLIAKLYNRGINMANVEMALVKFSVGGASYINRGKLFWEPYLIQRDVLHQPVIRRIASLLKRGISTLGMIVLQNIHKNKHATRHGD